MQAPAGLPGCAQRPAAQWAGAAGQVAVRVGHDELALAYFLVAGAVLAFLRRQVEGDATFFAATEDGVEVWHLNLHVEAAAERALHGRSERVYDLYAVTLCCNRV